MADDVVNGKGDDVQPMDIDHLFSVLSSPRPMFYTLSYLLLPLSGRLIWISHTNYKTYLDRDHLLRDIKLLSSLATRAKKIHNSLYRFRVDLNALNLQSGQFQLACILRHKAGVLIPNSPIHVDLADSAANGTQE